MKEVIPELRSDIGITVHKEGADTFLVLNDPFGFADGPIMVHTDMVEILELCDGETTFTELAQNSGVDPEGPEILRVRAFIGQLDEMGFLEGEKGESRRERVSEEWRVMEIRPAVCSGSTYPSDPEELKEYLSREIENSRLRESEIENSRLRESDTEGELSTSRNFEFSGSPIGLFIPHIDFRVANGAYGPGFSEVAKTDADLVVIIGTSHYWADDAIIVTEKSYSTPLGVLPTDVALVQEFATRVQVADTDIAHKPEHSIELHAVYAQHVLAGKPLTIIPILVSGAQDDHAVQALKKAGKELAEVVKASGKKALWLVSGDLSHVGRKFGDDQPAAALDHQIQLFDTLLMERLVGFDALGFHENIVSVENRYRICGHGPAIMGMAALAHLYGQVRGRQLAYDVWHESETQSAVSFGSVSWYR